MSDPIVRALGPIVYAGSLIHQPAPRNTQSHGGMTLAHFRAGELPLLWPAVCGERGHVYTKAALFSRVGRCPDCAQATSTTPDTVTP